MHKYSQQIILCCLNGSIRIPIRVIKTVAWNRLFLSLLRGNFGSQFWVVELPICSSHWGEGFSPDQSTDFCFKAERWFFILLRIYTTSLLKICMLLILETSVRAHRDKFQWQYCQTWMELVCGTKHYVISFPGKVTFGVTKFANLVVSLDAEVQPCSASLLLSELLISYCNSPCLWLFKGHHYTRTPVPSLQVLFRICCVSSLGIPPWKVIVSC